MSLVHVQNFGMHSPRHLRRRQWIEPGEPVWAGGDLFVQLEVDRTDGRYVPVVFFIRDAHGIYPRSVQRNLLYEGYWIDLREECGLAVLPRAIDFATDWAGNRKPVRVLMEFVFCREGVDWSIPAY